jgi:uncharacterized protein
MQYYAMLIGTLRAIYRYPVKSLRGEALDACALDADGLDGDRRRALVAGDAHPRAGKTYRGKENDRLHLIEDLDAALALAPGLTAAEDRDERYFDAAPVSLILDRWLDGLSDYVGYRVEYQRFRPNLYVETAPGIAFNEDDLTGRELQLGEVTLRVLHPIERCVVTTYDLYGGESDPRILRYVAQARETWMGIYCDVPRAGIARTGDSLELIER